LRWLKNNRFLVFCKLTNRQLMQYIMEIIIVKNIIKIFAVIDQEVVWYGNINLLAKTKVDDSIMRVLSKEIASELMEITFGDNG